MDEEAGEFYIEPEENEVREIRSIEDPNPIYSKVGNCQSESVSLKMIEIPKQTPTTTYQPFKITASKSESEDEEETDNQPFTTNSAFTEFYLPQQLVYQKYNNEQFNRVKDVVYFPGSFVPKNLFFDYLRQDSTSLIDVISEFYEIPVTNLPEPHPDTLGFSSDFQSGNLFAAFKISDREYDLVMQNDINSCGNNQWFYFSVEKMIPGAEYTFNIVNFTKSDSLFNYGMCPVAYSTLLHRKSGTDWFRIGNDVVYKKGSVPRQNSRRMYYKLSFKVNWRLSNDKLYFAYTFPYTYTKICAKLDTIIAKNHDIASKSTIGKTISKKNIEVLTIKQKVKTKKDPRKAIIIMARQHPGETQGSFVCDGVIDRLLTRGSKEADLLRKNFIIHVIPMVNPDGVIFGHYRTNLAGKDLNRKWDSTEKQLNCPEIVAIKSFIQEVSKQREIRFILDLHGHSKKLNSFFYGNPMPQSPEVVRIYPYLCSKMHPGVQFVDCTFATQEYKRKAARVYLSYLYKQIHVYTYEVSFYAYWKQGKKQQFNPKQFESLGQNLINCLSILLESQTKNQSKPSKDSSLFKIMNELKQNKKLLEVGAENQSGSDSKPEDGEINSNDIPELQMNSRKSLPQGADENEKSTKKSGSRKGKRDYREMREMREMSKPVRNIKFLEISRVNSVLPDRYQLGLQPIRKKQSIQPPIVRNQSTVIRISSHCQTDPNEIYFQPYNSDQIKECMNLVSSVRTDSKIANQMRYSSLFKNTRNNNNIIFKIDFVTERSNSTVNAKEKKVYYNTYCQTIITLQKYRHDRIKSSQLFPAVESPDTDRRNRSKQAKYETMKIGLKREAEIFLSGMVKKFLVDKQLRQRQSQPQINQRPLSIKRKQITRK